MYRKTEKLNNLCLYINNTYLDIEAVTELKISIPKELAKKIKDHPEVNWNKIIKAAIKHYANNLDISKNDIDINELMKLSEHSLEDFLNDEPDLYTDEDLRKRY